MKNVCRSDATSKVAVNIDVLGVQNFFHCHHGRNRNATLVDALGSDVRVTVDDSGNDELPGSVDDLCAGRGLDGLSDFRDFAVLNEDGTVLDGAVRNREHRGVLDQDDGGAVRRSRGSRRIWEGKEVQEGKEVKDWKARANFASHR